jgi:hypothetical protein
MNRIPAVLVELHSYFEKLLRSNYVIMETLSQAAQLAAKRALKSDVDREAPREVRPKGASRERIGRTGIVRALRRKPSGQGGNPAVRCVGPAA